jgi:hypothetical protein
MTGSTTNDTGDDFCSPYDAPQGVINLTTKGYVGAYIMGKIADAWVYFFDSAS